jgi:phosphate transport system permease protein
MIKLREWTRSGEPWIWVTAAAVGASILLVTGLLTLIMLRGVSHFWPVEVQEYVYQEEDGQRAVIAGQVRAREEVSAQRLSESGVTVEEGVETVERILLKAGNRDVTGVDFRWILEPRIVQHKTPLSMIVLERTEWGAFIGRLLGLKRDGELVETSDAWGEFLAMIQRADGLRDEIRDLEQTEIGYLNYQIEELRLEERRLQLKGIDDPTRYQPIEAERERLQESYAELEEKLIALNEELRRDSVIMQVAGEREVELALGTVLDAWRPNGMGPGQKVGHFFHKFRSFLTDDPREANTEGGIYPAIFGTVMMVLLMTVVVTPFGVIAGVYMKEYARQGALTRFIRIAVNNLAGVPSIVYGVFGLGFFIYTLGGSIDQLFFEAALPSPTFGTGGLFWASLTLALLTLPVVIVSTEEGLARIPRSIREGSLALGATQWETLWRTIIPMASPGIMTGLILAVARAAGEVAPLMLVGVVKLAPSLPLDGNPPFLHLERKFMHLGFHIYDVGFQSPNIEAARPLVYATAFLLVLVILLLNIVAIHVRNGLREKYKGLET